MWWANRDSLILTEEGCGVDDKISTRQRWLSNFNSSAYEMRGQEFKTPKYKGSYNAVTNGK